MEELTRQSDKLAAISGVARMLQRDTTAKYWAGLWSDTFPGALLWIIYDFDMCVRFWTSLLKRPKQQQAPEETCTALILCGVLINVRSIVRPEKVSTSYMQILKEKYHLPVPLRLFNSELFRLSVGYLFVCQGDKSYSGCAFIACQCGTHQPLIVGWRWIFITAENKEVEVLTHGFPTALSIILVLACVNYFFGTRCYKTITSISILLLVLSTLTVRNYESIILAIV